MIHDGFWHTSMFNVDLFMMLRLALNSCSPCFGFLCSGSPGVYHRAEHILLLKSHLGSSTMAEQLPNVLKTQDSILGTTKQMHTIK